jgi:hypothetical protein
MAVWTELELPIEVSNRTIVYCADNMCRGRGHLYLFCGVALLELVSFRFYRLVDMNLKW